MKSSMLQKDKKKKIEEKTIEDVRNLFRLKKEIDNTTIKDMRNLSRLIVRGTSTTIVQILNNIKFSTSL